MNDLVYDPPLQLESNQLSSHQDSSIISASPSLVKMSVQMTELKSDLPLNTISSKNSPLLLPDSSSIDCKITHLDSPIVNGSSSVAKISDQMTEPESVKPSPSETKPLVSPHIDSSNISQEHKCKKGRRKSGSRKHRAGRNQKRKYKPYNKLTPEERKKVDERNEKRSNRKREYLQSCGVILAPPNTTQFLLEDNIRANRDYSSASDYEDSIEDDDFNEIRFENMPERDLVMWTLDLEDEVEQYERQLAEKRERELEEQTKIKIFQDEVRRYEHEIEVLMKLNAKLLKDMPSKDEKIVDKNDQPLEEDLSSTDHLGSAVSQ